MIIFLLQLVGLVGLEDLCLGSCWVSSDRLIERHQRWRSLYCKNSCHNVVCCLLVVGG
ncbi:MAG: hypothetical protein HXY43_11960 [Fischerella sp.]|uniref:hypothetical protein n=1 Tax=unclassified Fischerella TaxID=494603 RepID=UPI0004B2416E|nr:MULTISPECIES: hypothetical protein [unclassified Fischerella]NWF59962.1 hypothetical protein [Fischerella sp.]